MSSASLNRSALGKLDWITLVTYICLILIGWMMIYASGYSELSETVTPFLRPVQASN